MIRVPASCSLGWDYSETCPTLSPTACSGIGSRCPRSPLWVDNAPASSVHSLTGISQTTSPKNPLHQLLHSGAASGGTRPKVPRVTNKDAGPRRSDTSPWYCWIRGLWCVGTASRTRGACMCATRISGHASLCACGWVSTSVYQLISYEQERKM